ncbi:XRE family transcriptional regulator [Herbiconiux sp. A18JL235]|uniref:XRE family transcriptional regulator n=1 Tax=Herbiconiux sp. A18JL235 TaxID=3152363 RepID=A0AB39BE84_9MICO
MSTSLSDVVARRPVDRASVEAIKERMLDEVRAYRLRELRKAMGLTQTALAQSLDVSQNRVSRLEHGDLQTTQIATLRRCVEALGGHLHIEVEIDDRRIQIA